ncbi:SIR2 family protein [Amycolatopsis sp. WQ 127309]|uniref:SIR2 family NAD-dependent protein deacylase n=1 Tax=Amycolatopsis sp. WQ 127309 TaxID=2932773 RepID=UPI001FF29D05|nr:SIR2 family protein [Amycolatopsis sp. WQ 127309]UOZ08759.1 SIR2 family protein [Amycolatopsis sp. WQ 127309]
MSNYLRSELIEALRSNSAVIIVGAGSSITATGGAEYSSWNSLLESGISRCLDLNDALGETWETARHAEIKSDDQADKLSLAEEITRTLKAYPGNHYAKWLKDTVGSLTASNPGLLQILGEFNVPILTTNYDGLIEAVTGRETVTWENVPEIQDEIQNPGKSVIHLHGHWRRPESVVFGYESYAQVIGDLGSQALLRSLLSVKSIIFVGFGAGLNDPNFSSLGTWLSTSLKDSGLAPVALVRSKEKELTERRYRQFKYNVLSYGAEYEDLEIYLADLRLACGESHPTGEPVINFTWDSLTPKLMRLHRRIERDYRPDFIIAMSGPGNFAPAYCLAHSSDDPPLLTAVTFPKRPKRSDSCVAFQEVAEKSEWIHQETTRWDIFLPNIIRHFPPGSKGLIFDDRAIGGRAQKQVASFLEGMKYEVRRAALVVHPDCAADVNYYEEVISGDFVFPWGGKYGRNEPPAG